MSGEASVTWSGAAGTVSWGVGAATPGYGGASVAGVAASEMRFSAMLAEAKAGGGYAGSSPSGPEGRRAPSPATDSQLRWAAEQLEALFVQQLLTAMRRTVPEGGLFNRSFATRTYEEMLDAERAQQLVQGRGLGLGDTILEALRG